MNAINRYVSKLTLKYHIQLCDILVLCNQNNSEMYSIQGTLFIFSFSLLFLYNIYTTLVTSCSLAFYALFLLPVSLLGGRKRLMFSKYLAMNLRFVSHSIYFGVMPIEMF